LLVGSQIIFTTLLLSSIQATEELAMGQVGIGENIRTEQELQKALNFVVCIPSMMNNSMEMSDTQDNITSNMRDGIFTQ